MFWRELGHIGWPLALGLVGAVDIFVGKGGFVLVGGEAEGWGGLLDGGCGEGEWGCAREGA